MRACPLRYDFLPGDAVDADALTLAPAAKLEPAATLPADGDVVELDAPADAPTPFIRLRGPVGRGLPLGIGVRGAVL